MIRFDTGIILHPGGYHGRAHVGVVGGMSVGDTYYTTKYNNGLIVQDNVGIGTNDPTAKLDVKGDVFLGLSANHEAVGTLTLGRADSSTHRRHSITVKNSLTQTSNYMAFNVHNGGEGSNIHTAAPVERMRIKGDGKVGIGTTSPDRKLEVAGDLKATDISGTNIQFSGELLGPDGTSVISGLVAGPQGTQGHTGYRGTQGYIGTQGEQGAPG